MKRWLFVFLLAALGGLSGCAASPPAPQAREGEPRTAAEPNIALGERENAQALTLLKARKYDEAGAAFKSSLVANPNNGPAHNNLGTVYFHQRKYYLAAWEYQFAARLMPRHPEPPNNLGMVFEEVGKLDDAVNWYGRAVERETDNPEFIGNLVRARVRRGDDGEEVRALLAKLVSTDMRPQWVAWARERLARLHGATTNSPGAVQPPPAVRSFQP